MTTAVDYISHIHNQDVLGLLRIMAVNISKACSHAKNSSF